MAIPNLQHVVEEVKNRYPRAFSKCHIPGDPEGWDFIILAAKEIHKIDNRFGLNGKRGGNELSWDALNFNSPGEENVIDVVAGAGAPGASIYWGVTNTTGKWFNPNAFITHYDYGNPVPPVEPVPPTPEPGPNTELIVLLRQQNELLRSLLSEVQTINSYIMAVQADKLDQLIAHADNRSNQIADIRQRMNGSFTTRVRL